MAEMPKHEAGDAVFVREEQHQTLYSAKVHDLPTNLSFVEITKDADGTIKKVENYKVLPQKQNMSVLVSGNNKTKPATITSFNKATKNYTLNIQGDKAEYNIDNIYGWGKYPNGDYAELTNMQTDFNNSCSTSSRSRTRTLLPRPSRWRIT